MLKELAGADGFTLGISERYQGACRGPRRAICQALCEMAGEKGVRLETGAITIVVEEP